MKRYVLSTIAIVLAVAAAAPVATAGQTHLTDDAADLNGDGQVTLTELKIYNRDQRQN